MMLLFPVCRLFRFPLLRISDWFMKSFSCGIIHESIYYYCCCCYFYCTCSFSLVDIHIDASLNTSHSKHKAVSNTSVSIEKFQLYCGVILFVCLFFFLCFLQEKSIFWMEKAWHPFFFNQFFKWGRKSFIYMLLDI